MKLPKSGRLYMHVGETCFLDVLRHFPFQKKFANSTLVPCLGSVFSTTDGDDFYISPELEETYASISCVKNTSNPLMGSLRFFESKIAKIVKMSTGRFEIS